MNDDRTIVIFRKFRDGDIIALMPAIPDHAHYVMSYMHIGQHSGADYRRVIEQTKPATQDEYAPLKRELEEIGYRVDARLRYTRRRKG